MWHVSRRRHHRHRLGGQDEIPAWGLPLILALACVIGLATAMVVARG
jgi:hypothetical protein